MIRMKLNFCLFVVGVVLCGMSGYVSYNYYDGMYFDCLSTNCTYSKTRAQENSCYIESEYGLCGRTPCPYKFEGTETVRYETCYVPNGQSGCPTSTCYTQAYQEYAVSSAFLAVIDAFCLSFVIYHLCMFFYRCHVYRKQQYTRVNGY